MITSNIYLFIIITNIIHNVINNKSRVIHNNKHHPPKETTKLFSIYVQIHK